jgi:serine/threonine protein phosphatase 1
LNRHLAIGDIHGCLNSLRTLVDFVGLRPDDTVVTIGDYVDRGPDSAGVIDYIIELGKSHHLVPLRGNHEIMMLDSRDKKSWLHAWKQYGGDATLSSYASGDGETGSFADIPATHIDFLENQLLPFYECETHIFVHANVDADAALEDQTDATLYWRKYNNPEPHCSGKFMVCGHSAQQSGVPRRNDHSVCIDTWAHGDGWLSCLDVVSGTIWQANESGDTRNLDLDEIDAFVD